MNKRIVFLTGTRADFGKLKSLIAATDQDTDFDVHVFITGMHMLPHYGSTWDEVRKCGFSNIHTYINQDSHDAMDSILANTVDGLGKFVRMVKPDLIVVHGDRVEALAGAIVGALNNVLVAHIEGGEVSGTIDESIRHSVSKLAHIHFVANQEAKERLLRMGEQDSQVFVIGSPDLDLMLSPTLPSIEEVKQYYSVPFEKYALFMYHPVTTIPLSELLQNIREVIAALIESTQDYVIIYPNNDSGTEIILQELKKLEKLSHFRIFPSVRFEYFLTFLKNASFIIGNSSAGVREAPFYAVPSINIGYRQYRRFSYPGILDVKDQRNDILQAIEKIPSMECTASSFHFGEGKSTELFIRTLKQSIFWDTRLQKEFKEIAYV